MARITLFTCYYDCATRHNMVCSNTVCSTWTYVQNATNSMAKCVHPNTVVKIENKNFSVLAWYELC